MRKIGLLLLSLIFIPLFVLRGAAWMREQPLPVPAHIQMVDTRYGPVAVDVRGPAEGPVVLLIHGSAGWSGFWRDVSAHLAAKGWRSVAIDVPPFGYSAHDPQMRYDRISQAIRLADIATKMSDKPVYVVGHSFGGGAATEFALRSPDKLQSLILVDPAMGAIDPAKGSKSAAERILSFRPAAELTTSATITNPYAMEPLLKPMLARKEAAARWTGTLFEPMQRQGSTSAYAAWLPTLFAQDDGAWSRETDKLKAIKVPVALIWGRDDTVTPLAQGEHLAKLFNVKHFTILSG